MYKKARIRLTALFTAVTGTLLLALLAVSFFLSARSQYSLWLSGFSRQSASVFEETRQQNVLTTDWLVSREASGSFCLFLMDQGVPIFHNSTHPEAVQELFETAYQYFSETDAQTDSGSGEQNKSGSFAASKNQGSFFHFGIPAKIRQVSETPAVYACYNGFLPAAFFCQNQTAKNDSVLQIFSIQPLAALNHEILRNAALYLLLFVSAGCFLAAFSWYFTGRMLQPLRNAQESQNRFISAASHELRTPLAVILANASACEKASASDQAPFFRIIEREGAQMSEMLEQLLTLSRADSHALRLQICGTDLQTLLLKVYEAFLPLAAQSSHSLSIRLPEQEIPLWPCDAFRIEQICTILVRNALSYTPCSSRIVLSLNLLQNRAEISVCDNGPGIPDSEKEKIFDRFYRGSTIQQSSGSSPASKIPDCSGTETVRVTRTAPEKGHHGLGLSVAREIALAHSGTLTVRDAPGGGALFVLGLPGYACDRQL